MTLQVERRRAPFKHALQTAILALLPVLLPTVQAAAHATFEKAEVEQNASLKAVLRVPHGCDGQATNLVRITIPEGVIAVKPMPKAGWKLDTRSGDCARTYQLYGKPVSKGIKEIIWSGGALADDHFDEFIFQMRATEFLPAGKTLYLPVVQECASARAAWTEIPADGQDPHALKAPAPGIRILAQHQTGHGAGPAASIKVGALTITQPWSRATPGGAKVAGGFMKITNNGPEPDRLIDGAVEFAGVFEVHEMAMEGGVMKMRALDKGLEIAPGATVELKPGGYHVMFIDLKRPLRQGDRVKGHLVFEKAGKVEVEYEIGAMGAASAGGHQH